MTQPYPRPFRKPRQRWLFISGMAAVLAVAGCGSSTVTASRYSSARQVIAALGQGGLRCTGATYNTPVVSGAISEATCNFTATENPLIDVFPGTVTTAMVLADSVSTGTQKIWSDVGPNWQIQTDSAYVKRVQAILGGRIIGGPWHPATAAPAAAPSIPSAPTCDISGWESGGYEDTVSTDLQQLNTDIQAGDSETMAADGTTLKNDALVALHNLPPRCAARLRHDVKEQMVFFGIAGGAVEISVLDPAGPSRDYNIATEALKHANHYTDRVRADESSFGY